MVPSPGLDYSCGYRRPGPGLTRAGVADEGRGGWQTREGALAPLLSRRRSSRQAWLPKQASTCVPVATFAPGLPDTRVTVHIRYPVST